ncbi:hypothetical protein FRB97_009735, partial [Tulasnella sp. 331]
VLLPKLSHAVPSWYHLLNNCTLLHGTTTLVPNAADAQIIPFTRGRCDLRTLQVEKTRDLLQSTRLGCDELALGLEKMQMNSGCVMFSYLSPRYLRFEELENICVEREVHDGFIEDWLRGVSSRGGTGDFHSTLHHLYGRIRHPQNIRHSVRNRRLSPIEGLDTSSPNDNALLSPASPSLFKLLTQAMVDARMSKEEGKLPLEKISPWNTAALSVKIQQYPFRNLANTEPRELAYIKIIYCVLTQSSQHGNGFPTIRRGSLTPPPTPTAEQTALDVEQGYDGDVYEIMGLRVAPTTTVGNASTGLNPLAMSDEGVGLTFDEADKPGVAVDVVSPPTESDGAPTGPAMSAAFVEIANAPASGTDVYNAEMDGAPMSTRRGVTEGDSLDIGKGDVGVEGVSLAPVDQATVVEEDEEFGEVLAQLVPAHHTKTCCRREQSRQGRANSVVPAEGSSTTDIEDASPVDAYLASHRKLSRRRVPTPINRQVTSHESDEDAGDVNERPSAPQKRRIMAEDISAASSTPPSISIARLGWDVPVERTNATSPATRSLRIKPTVDYAGESVHKRAIEALKERQIKAAVQKMEQGPTSPERDDTEKVVKEEVHAKIKALEKKWESRKLAEEKVAIAVAQKTARITSQVEKRKRTRSTRTIAAATASSDPSIGAATAALRDKSSDNNTGTSTASALTVSSNGYGGTDRSDPSSMMKGPVEEGGGVRDALSEQETRRGAGVLCGGQECAVRVAARWT